RSRTLPGVAGQGDLIEQRNVTTSVGALARYRTAAMDIGSVHSHIEFGTTARFDAIEQEQNLLNAVVRGQTWDQRVDAAITALDVGLRTDFDLHLTRWLELRL